MSAACYVARRINDGKMDQNKEGAKQMSANSIGKLGRPSSYTKAKADKICEDIANGMSLAAVCRQDGMPAPKNVRVWLKNNPDFLSNYALARAEQADHFADEIIAIADDSSKDIIQTENGPKVNHDHINRDRLRIDTRKWKASKMRPEKYGAKLQVDHKVNYEAMSNQELLKRLEQLCKNMGLTMPEHYRIERETT